ncbi:hypothetical protein A374_01574 [Fictibacillus macauensis ZFHKF-1]|uniref:Accessory Sec system S-layer assembly protein n=1 Tax=Fictibacillus macauensis ZFHKF-1 TaxID=1196324 RepID=I8AMJ6_9BACL|nr:accessory Sec system S-layer assembly protein [Fictibacillus macauensis]EIT86904.1 hypothetical protein A374_01574 [Fictibacillus macauensis ZFHKF-1]
MLSYFKKKKDTPPSNETTTPQVEKRTVPETTLHFHHDWDLSLQEKYVYRYHHTQLPPLQPNQISISKIDVVSEEGSYMVNAFIRSTVERNIHFEEITLLLLDETGAAFARKTFDLETMGHLPPLACMPWIFLFSEEDLLVDSFPMHTSWSLAFEWKQKTPAVHELSLHDSWETTLQPEEKVRLQNIVTSLPPLSAGEVNFMGIEAQQQDDGALAIMLLIRNGSEKDIAVERLPLCIEDASGSIIAQGTFTLDDFTVRANTSKPWTFHFPASLLETNTPDLSVWKAYPPQLT